MPPASRCRAHFRARRPRGRQAEWRGHEPGGLDRPRLGRADDRVGPEGGGGEKEAQALGLKAALLGQRPNVIGAGPLHRIAGVGVAQEMKLDLGAGIHRRIIAPGPDRRESALPPRRSGVPLQGRGGSPQGSPERRSRDRPPDGAERPAAARKLALARMEVSPDGIRLGTRQLPDPSHQDVAGQLARDVGVVQAAQEILQGHDPLQKARRIGSQSLTEELQVVAQPLGRDPQLMERLDVRPRRTISKARTAS